MADNEDGRVELKDLDAREVSFVDSPAIGEKFVVVKRQKGGTEMADEDKSKKDEETQGKSDEEKTDKEKDEETQGKEDKEKTDEKKDGDKDEETQAVSPAIVGALKQMMGLVNKLMKLAGVGGYGEPTKKSEDAEDGVSVDTLMAEAQFMLDELGEGRVPDAEAVEKAGKRVTPSRLKKLEAFQAELATFIADLKGDAAKEEDGEKKDKTEKTGDADLDGDVGKKILDELGKVNKRLDAVEAGGGASRGESEDESGGGKEKTEKSAEGDMSGFFVGIGGIN